MEIDHLGDAYRDVIGYLPQEFGFYPEFTVQQYLEYIAALKGLTDRAVLLFCLSLNCFDTCSKVSSIVFSISALLLSQLC